MLAVTPAAALRRTAQLLALVLAALVLGGSVTLVPALAQEAPPQVTVTLTAEGPTPEFVEVPAGGTVVFVNDDDTSHQVTATVEDGKSTAWDYDSGPIPPRDGENRPASEPTPPFEQPGRYTFNDARGLLVGRQDFPDEIGVQPAPSSSPSPEPSGSAEPSGEPSASSSPEASGSPSAGGEPSATAGPSTSASPGAPPPAGGTGTTSPLPLSGGFGSTGSAPIPIPGDPLAPAIAPPPLPDAPPAPLPLAAAPEQSAPTVAALPTGSLPGSDTGRDQGLPAVLAALAIVGVVSMLVRVLLAEPAAHPAGDAARGVRPVVVTG